MAIEGQIHWHEGLFLQPHHLQAMQQVLAGGVDSERRLLMPFPYGVIDARLSPDALENMLVQFDKLRVIMPSGLEINVPDNADLPPLDIKKAFQASGAATTVLLGIPILFENRSNTIDPTNQDDGRARKRYVVREIQQRDENTGDNAQPLAIRRLNPRLLLEGDDTTDMEVLPVLRIAPAAGADVGLPRQEATFVPPCLVLSGSRILLELVRDLSNQVEASRKELVMQAARAGFSVDTMRGVQFEQILRLRTLNRFTARLPHLFTVPGVTPHAAYVELHELLAELAALAPDRDPFEIGPYDHDHPAPPFMELSSRIRSLLRGTVAPKFMQVNFVRDGKTMVAELTDEHLTKANEYFLGIKTREDPRAVAQLVEDPDKFKFMAKSMVNQRIFGVKLAEERYQPVELPQQAGLNYFRLMRAEGRMWERIASEKSMAIRWPDVENSDFTVTLYMTAPA